MLYPVVQSLRRARESILTGDTLPTQEEADDLKSFRFESEEIVKTYIAVLMKNAVFSLSNHHEDIAYIDFIVGQHTDKDDIPNISVSLDVVDNKNRIIKHSHIDSVAAMVENFVNTSFSPDEAVEFLDGYRVMASGVVVSPDKKNTKNKI